VDPSFIEARFRRPHSILMKTTPPGGGLVDDCLWYRDAIVYQTQVKAFLDTNDDRIGDFRGLTERLDYIRDLGVNAIWLLRFYPSPMRDDGYDIADYRNIHPPYGTRRDFRRFVRAAHRRGIRVIIELGWASLQPQKAQRRQPTQRALATLEDEVLPAYLPTRRWFGGAGGDITRVRILARQEWENRLLTLVQVVCDGLPPKDYSLPLSILWNGQGPAEEAVAGVAAAALARVRRHATHGLLFDAFADEGFARGLVQAIGEGGEVPLDSGRLTFSPTSAYGQGCGSKPRTPWSVSRDVLRACTTRSARGPRRSAGAARS
jgi:hypothetical protein